MVSVGPTASKRSHAVTARSARANTVGVWAGTCGDIGNSSAAGV